ncbi:mucoidy inhibitor MuiA family protein [Polaribacter sp.]|nr:mucoidy inhibitor MuiA family protein [Polaribacter sp.]
MKRKAITLLITLSIFQMHSQEPIEKEINSKVDAATVFQKSAQVQRNKTVTLEKGIQILKFVNLSPFIDKKSIQVKSTGIEIQAVNFKKNYLKGAIKSNEQLALENKLAKNKKLTDIETIDLETSQEEIQFLKNNRSIKGNQTLTVTALKAASIFYGGEMNTLKKRELTLKNNLKKLREEKKEISNQLNDLTSKKRYASGEIFIKVKSSSNKKIEMEVTYNVSNVSWHPSYDVRVSDINSPLTLVYKANLKQNSKVDWTNVKLQFSSANPSSSTKAGEIIPYFLDYGTRPPYYSASIDEVSGYVLDGNGPLPGVSVVVKGTTIGTSTDFDGKYSIKIPKKRGQLQFSYLGYKTEIKRINNPVLNVQLEEDENNLDEIVVTGYGSTRKKNKIDKALKGRVAGMSITKNTAIPTQQIINQTSFSFEVIAPYTIKSSNKDFMIAMKTYESKADYTYYSIPRIEEKAFLLAAIEDWEQFNLLEGEANVYFENTFIGTTLIDTRTTKKLLSISLGMDKNISINKVKSKDFTTKQFIGSKKEEFRAWDIEVKNNKAQNIKIVILDQIPISTREEIKVSLDEDFKGVLNKKNGEVKWTFSLDSKTSQKLRLKYAVKYPKNKSLIID